MATATGRAPILRQLHLLAAVLACASLLVFSLLFLGAKLSPCGIHEARLRRATPSDGSSRTWQMRGKPSEAGEAGEAQRCCRHWLHCCCLCFCFCFCFCQDVLLCGVAGRRWASGGVGQMADKNYYRPNKRYFSRDECALVRVLFYFVELQPAS